MKHDPNFAALVEETDRSLETLINREVFRALQQHEDTYAVLANVYAVHLAGIAQPALYGAFLKERGVKVMDKAQTDAHPTVLAFFPPDDRHRNRQRVSKYAQCLHVLAERGVAAADAEVWFGEPEKLGSRTLTGLAKALRIYRDLPEVKARNKERRDLLAKTKQADLVRVLEVANENVCAVARSAVPLTMPINQHVVLIGCVTGQSDISILHVIDDQAALHDLVQRHFVA